MKLPLDVAIAPEKLTGYLLIPRPRSDKSRYLALAGYDRSNSKSLQVDLHALAQTAEAVASGTNAYGEFFTADGVLQGPNGKIIAVRTVWIQLTATGQTHFVTLPPSGK